MLEWTWNDITFAPYLDAGAVAQQVSKTRSPS
jgi:hypothetical protein